MSGDSTDLPESFLDAFSNLSVANSTMTDGQAAGERSTTTQSGHFSFSRRPALTQREALTFSGRLGEDPVDWLKSYERVSRYNDFDDTMKLANVPFCLADSALVWFNNHEDELTSWTVFKDLFCQAFSVFNRRQAAEASLGRRFQKPGESVRDYFEDVLRLCSRVDPEMSPAKKVEYLMDGIRDEFFLACMHSPPETPDAFLTKIRSMEQQLERRRLRRAKVLNTRLGSEFFYDDYVATPATDDIPPLVQRLVRNELAASRYSEVPVETEATRPLSAADVVRIVRNELRASSRRPASRSPPRRQSPPRTTPQRRTDRWRTQDNTPLCFHCGRAGHVQRYCRFRQQELSNTSRRSTPLPPRYEASRERFHYRDDDYPPLPATSRSRTPSPQPPARNPASWSSTPRARSPSPGTARRRMLSPATRPSRRDVVN